MHDEIRDDEMTAEQHAEIEGMMLEWEAQITRVGVDMEAAQPKLREIAPETEREISETEIEVTFTLDLNGILDTLRSLPDGAGTDRFIAAYNARSLSVDPPRD